MPNIWWYILLAVIGLVTSAVSIYLKKDKYRVSTFIILYLFAAGLSWVGEFIVLGLFDSYAYRTGIFKDIWAQNLLGHLILNTTLYPMTAVVMIAFSLKYRWMFIIDVIFISAEYLFLSMGIYEHHWWRYIFTFIVTIIFLMCVRYWFYKMINHKSRVMIGFMLYFSALVIVHIPAPIITLLGFQHYGFNLITQHFNDYYRSSIMFNFTYHVIECFFIILFAYILKNRFWKAAPFIISIAVQTLLAKLNILTFSNGWNLSYTLIVYQLFIGLFLLLEGWFLKSLPNTEGSK